MPSVRVLNFFKTVFSALSEIFGFFKQNQLIQAGEDKVVAKQATKEIEIVIKANEAREDARADAGTILDSDVLPDDGFRRD